MNEELKQQIKDELLQPRDMEVLRLTQRVIANENDERSFRANLASTLEELKKQNLSAAASKPIMLSPRDPLPNSAINLPKTILPLSNTETYMTKILFKKLQLLDRFKKFW